MALSGKLGPMIPMQQRKSIDTPTLHEIAIGLSCRDGLAGKARL
jgi:hypothetical protein